MLLASLIVAGTDCGPLKLVAIEPLPPVSPLGPTANVLVLPPYEQTFWVNQRSSFTEEMLTEAAAKTGRTYPNSIRETFFTMFAHRLQTQSAERGGPAISLLSTALWTELENSHLKYVARGAENISYGSAFRVPSLKWLRAHALEADFLVAMANFWGGVQSEALPFQQAKGSVFGSLIISLTVSVRLMVWDASQERMLAATTILKSRDGTKVSAEDWQALAWQAADEVAKLPILDGSNRSAP